MAVLIVDDTNTENGEVYEMWYDFNPEDTETVGKIEALLADNKVADRKKKIQLLSELCEDSFRKKDAAGKKKTLTSFRRTIGKQFSTGMQITSLFLQVEFVY